MGEEVEEYWSDNENVAIIDFLDDVGQPYSCAQWGIIEDDSLPTIIDDGGYNLHEQFYDIYPTNVFIDHEMIIHSILDTMNTAGSVNEIIQAMLDNMDLSIEDNHSSYLPYNTISTNIYPNPFNPVLHINFVLSWAGMIKVDIMDITGAHIENLHSGYLYSGNHELSWNAESMPSGVYLVSMNLGEQNLAQKVVLLK